MDLVRMMELEGLLLDRAIEVMNLSPLSCQMIEPDIGALNRSVAEAEEGLRIDFTPPGVSLRVEEMDLKDKNFEKGLRRIVPDVLVREGRAHLTLRLQGTPLRAIDSDPPSDLPVSRAFLRHDR